MKSDPRVKAISARIEKHLDYTNGWSVSTDEYRLGAEDAARDILAYLARRERTRVTKALKKGAVG